MAAWNKATQKHNLKKKENIDKSDINNETVYCHLSIGEICV